MSTTITNDVKSLSVKKKGAFIGAEITGIDLREELSKDLVQEISMAHAKHGVLVFPDQDISSEDLMRFGKYFGDLSVHPFSTSSEDNAELIVYDNKEGNPPAPTDIWHTDETFRECPPMGTALCSKIIPEYGGDTAFSSMEAVWEGLSDKMQNFLSGLEAIHDFKPFRMLFDETPEGKARLRKYEDMYPPMVHPIVRVHPLTGKKSIFVNPQFTICIKGMDDDESKTLLNLLYRKTLRNEYQYRHHWQPNMLVFWDNRNVQHSAVHDYYPQRRLMERVTIAGDRPATDVPPVTGNQLRRYLMPPITDFKGRVKRQHEK